MKRSKRLARVASNVLTLLAILLFAALAVGPHTGAYRTLTVLSGSMSPSIPPGSVVAVVPTDPSELTDGMVITYAIPVEDHRVVTHRVIDVIKGGEQPIVQTKGDANDVADAWVAQLDGGPIWAHRATVPYLGFGISFMRQPAVRKISVLGTPLIFLIAALSQIWRGGASPAKDQASENTRRTRQPRAKRAEAWLVSDPLPRPRPRPRLAVAGATAVVLLVATLTVGIVFAAPALAVFRSTVAAQHTVATGQLVAPTSATAVCAPNKSSVRVTWSQAGDSLTTGYTVWRSTGGAYSQHAAVSGADTTTYTDSDVAKNTSYTYQLGSSRDSWSSGPSPATSPAVAFAGNTRC